MFKAIYSLDVGKLKKGLLPNDLAEWTYSYDIVDDDFREIWSGDCKQILFHTLVRCGAVINCYEAKGLNVAYNIMLYHRYMKDNFAWYKLQDEIDHNIKHTPKYYLYVDKVKEYMGRINNLKVFW